MTLHLVKLCVGADSIADLEAWQRGRPAPLSHRTFQTPKRVDALLAGGSLYWVIKGVIQARQRLTGFDAGQKDDGSPCCLILLDPVLVPVRPVPRRPFQGWRYLGAGDAPGDLGARKDQGQGALPSPKMLRDLAELGLL